PPFRFQGDKLWLLAAWRTTYGLSGANLIQTFFSQFCSVKNAHGGREPSKGYNPCQHSITPLKPSCFRREVGRSVRVALHTSDLRRLPRPCVTRSRSFRLSIYWGHISRSKR